MTVYIATDPAYASWVADLMAEIGDIVGPVDAWWTRDRRRWPWAPGYCTVCHGVKYTNGTICEVCRGTGDNPRYARDLNSAVLAGKEAHAQLALRTIESVRAADFIVVVLWDTVDDQTPYSQHDDHAILGLAVALNKPVLLFGLAVRFESSAACPLYFAPGVQRRAIKQREMMGAYVHAAVRLYVRDNAK